MKERLTPKVVALLACAAVLIIALAGWFTVVAPQRSTAARLEVQISDARTNLLTAKIQAQSKSPAKAAARTSRLLAVALPDRVAMPRMLRELLFAARRAGVTLDSVTLQPVAPLSGYQVVPMNVAVTGRFGGVQSFLNRLRGQAGATGEGLHASGRLFTVDTVDFVPAEAGAPKITATLLVNAFVYDGTPPVTSPAAVSVPTSSSATAAGRTP